MGRGAFNRLLAWAFASAMGYPSALTGTRGPAAPPLAFLPSPALIIAPVFGCGVQTTLNQSANKLHFRGTLKL